MKSPAFIVGNGTSRLAFNLKTIKDYMPEAIIFGANALYRVFAPDYLIAFDEGIVKEIQRSAFPKEKLIVPEWEDQFEPFEANPGRPRNNAGMVAMTEAIKMGYNELILLGMDFVVEDAALNAANVFDNTNNYGPQTRASVPDTINRCRYFIWFAQHNLGIKFTFVFPEQIEEMPGAYRLPALPNVNYMTYTNLFHK